MVAGILYCLNLNLMESDLGAMFTFKTKLCVTTINNTSQSLPIFRYRELYIRCCIKFELNIIIWSTKNLKGTGGHAPKHIIKCNLGKI